MEREYKTEQEEFWAGEFGDEYVDRNVGDKRIANNTSLFSKVLSKCEGVDSVIEFGSNVGLNLHAISRLLPHADISAIEINNKAIEELKKLPFVNNVFHESILDFESTELWDLVFIKGVLIHINPESLEQVYRSLYEASRKYILVAEYYNRTPVEIEYRGHSGRLFKRNFAGEILDMFSDLQLVDYGFVWHRDSTFPLDDNTWFLMEKRSF